jgi:hypothetical protein
LDVGSTLTTNASLLSPKEITKNKTGQVIPHEGDNYLIVVEVVVFFGLLREKNLVLISYFNTTYF